MPWSNNHLPKYRQHRASGQAVVTLNGRDFYLGPHNTKTSKIAYDRLVGEWLQNNRNPLVVASDGITVVEMCARYYIFAKDYYQRNGNCTREAPNIRLDLRFLREWYGKTPAAGFGPLALKILRRPQKCDPLALFIRLKHVTRTAGKIAGRSLRGVMVPAVYFRPTVEQSQQEFVWLAQSTWRLQGPMP